MGSDFIGLALGVLCLLFSAACFAYCYAKNIASLLPIAVILAVPGALNIAVALR